MQNNYPIKNNKQHEHNEYDSTDYIDTSSESFGDSVTSDPTQDVEVEMSHSLHDMRREFKRTAKKLRNLYSNKEPRVSKYKYESLKYPGMNLSEIRMAKSHAIG